MKCLVTFVFLFWVSTPFAQLLTKNDAFGITSQSMVLVLNSSEKILKEPNYNISLGLYYDFINSDLFSIPIYATYSLDNYMLKDMNKRTSINYFDFELAYRKHLVYNINSRIYIEAGFQNRFILNSNKMITSNNNELFLTKYNLLPKFGIGFEIYGKERPFAYLNVEYWNSIRELFKNDHNSLNKYVGIKMSFPLIQ